MRVQMFSLTMLVAVLMAGVAFGSELLVNGDFETGTWGAGGAPQGWATIPFNHQNRSTVTTAEYVHGGSQSMGFIRHIRNSTYPLIHQTFEVDASATSFTVSGYCLKADSISWPSTIRIRAGEAPLGAAGTVKFYDGREIAGGGWQDNTVTYALPSSYYQGDKYGIWANASYRVNTVANVWEYFSYEIPVLAGVTTYTLDLAGTGMDTDETSSSTYFDDVSVTAVPEPATLTLLGISGLMMLSKKRK